MALEFLKPTSCNLEGSLDFVTSRFVNLQSKMFILLLTLRSFRAHTHERAWDLLMTSRACRVTTSGELM